MRAAAGSLYKGISDLLNLPSIMYPDIYNQQEKQAADTYKFYGKVGGGFKVATFSHADGPEGRRGCGV